MVAGGSAVGMEALAILVSALPEGLPVPVVAVLHQGQGRQDTLGAGQQQRGAGLRARTAADKEPLRPGSLFIAPSGYHLLVEDEQTLALSVDPPECCCRPAIDPLFESAASIFTNGLVAVLLSGANSDGAAGLRSVKAHGGLTLVQDPATAATPAMPRSAIESGAADHGMGPQDIAALLRELAASTGAEVEG